MRYVYFWRYFSLEGPIQRVPTYGLYFHWSYKKVQLYRLETGLPMHQWRLVVDHIIYRFLLHPRLFAEFLPSTVWAILHHAHALYTQTLKLTNSKLPKGINWPTTQHTDFTTNYQSIKVSFFLRAHAILSEYIDMYLVSSLFNNFHIPNVVPFRII